MSRNRRLSTRKRSGVSEEQLQTLERINTVSVQEDKNSISNLMPDRVSMNPTKAKFLKVAVEQRIKRVLTLIEDIEERRVEGVRTKDGNLARRRFEVKTLRFFMHELDQFVADEELEELIQVLTNAGISQAAIAAVVAEKRKQR